MLKEYNIHIEIVQHFIENENLRDDELNTIPLKNNHISGFN